MRNTGIPFNFHKRQTEIMIPGKLVTEEMVIVKSICFPNVVVVIFCGIYCNNYLVFSWC